MKTPGYLAFEGMVWRDTFNVMTKSTGQQTSMQFMQDNDVRANRQDAREIGVIVCNPPYSAWQRSADDDNANVFYSHMRRRIEQTYAVRSRAKLRISLNDHYKMAMRWATDRLPAEGGVIGMVTNGSFLDSNVDSGLRASLAEEFSSVYVLNLRGDARTSGEQRRKEKDNVFGQGTRTPIAITLFVKNPSAAYSRCQIKYIDVGDYLPREQKLQYVKQARSIERIGEWQSINPDGNFDWLNLSDPTFKSNDPIGRGSGFDDQRARSIFGQYANGLKTHRDVWLHDFDKEYLSDRIQNMIAHFNQVSTTLQTQSGQNLFLGDQRRIKWTPDLKRLAERGTIIRYNPELITLSSYRPFTKLAYYYDGRLVAALTRIRTFYPTPNESVKSILVSGTGGSKPFSCFIADQIPNLHLVEAGQSFPRSTYEDLSVRSSEMWDISNSICTCGNAMPCGIEVELDGKPYIRHDNILDEALEAYQSNYDDASIAKDDLFYYVYGLLHSPLFNERFENNLRRELPRIPLAPDFWAFSKAGRAPLRPPPELRNLRGIPTLRRTPLFRRPRTQTLRTRHPQNALDRQRSQSRHPRQRQLHPRQHPARRPPLRRQRPHTPRVDHRPLLHQNRQTQRHRPRPQQVVRRNRR